MSYDFCVREVGDPPPCKCCGRGPGSAYVDLGDPTYNVGDMFRLATGGWFKQGTPVPVAEAAVMWADAVAHMRDHAEDYKPLEPENGRGSYAGALRCAEKVAGVLLRIVRDGGIECPAWEPLVSGEYDTDEEKAARPKRFVSMDDLVFVA